MDQTLVQLINEIIRLTQENAALKAELAQIEDAGRQAIRDIRDQFVETNHATVTG